MAERDAFPTLDPLILIPAGIFRVFCYLTLGLGFGTIIRSLHWGAYDGSVTSLTEALLIGVTDASCRAATG